jgi:glutamyl-tRNA reductase
MQIGVLGINHKSAPLKLRERVAQVCACCNARDKVVLSTCNRTEIYFSGDDLASLQCELFSELKHKLNHSSEHAFYTFFGRECFLHLSCVTSGIDSKLLAESDIQRQVKQAYASAKAQGCLSYALHYLFQKSLKLAKDARSNFPLFQSTIHLEGIVYQIVDSVLEECPSLLLIGNSDINRKIVHYFSRRKKGRITLVSRDLEAAYPFALDYGITLKSREELSSAHLYDGIVSATTASEYLISSLGENKKTRLILDLSVPRSIHPNVGLDPSVTLLNMEQIGEHSAQAHTVRHTEVEQVKKFLDVSVRSYTERFMRKLLFLRVQNESDCKSCIL